MAFDGDLFAVAAEGDGLASVSMKGAAEPLYPYAFQWSGGILYAASIDGDWRESFEAGEQLTPRALTAFYALFSPEQLELLQRLAAPPAP